MPESHVYELEVRITSAGQEAATVHREYHTEKASVDGAAGEIAGALEAVIPQKLRKVNDGS